LNQDDLVIADEKKAIAIAGVFGGEDSGVSIESTDIFIESAWFDPVSIRKTAKKHGLNTDASFRYERGVDPNIGEYSLKMAWKLILRIFPEAYVESYSEKKSEKFNLDNRTLEVDLIKINKLIGHDIKVTDVKSILKSLDIEIKKESKSKLNLSIPLYRWDVTREADIAEEILRIYGFNSIPLPKHLRVSERKGTSISNDSIRKKATDFLVAKGFYEIMNNSLTSSKLYSDHPSLNPENNVNIINPLSQELGIMRPSMLLGGLDVIGYNQKRQQSNIFIFEFGRVYNKSKNSEQNQLAIWHSGQYPVSNWNSKKSKTDFFSLKGIIEGLFSYLGIHDIDEETLIPKQGEWGHGVKLLSNQKTLGKIFWVDDWAKNISDIQGDILASNIDWDAIFEIVQLSKIQYQEISKFPHVNRDLAIIIRSEITYSDIKKTILEVKEKTLCKIQLFDVFQSEKLGKNLISYGVRLTFEDLKKTLKDKQVENSIKKIVEALKVKIGGEIRSS
jgi:phenylalanyl-tRNA synthetase beta chain